MGKIEGSEIESSYKRTIMKTFKNLDYCYKSTIKQPCYEGSVIQKSSEITLEVCWITQDQK